MPALPTFKRVITGHDARGRAVAIDAAPTPHVFPLQAVPGTVFHELWNSQGSPVPIDNAGDPCDRALKLGPATQGSVLRVVDIPPDSQHSGLSPEAAAAAFAEIGQAQAGTGHATSRHALMHRTETLDYGVLLEGELWLVLDDQEIHLTRGDVVVQRGTNHAWSNRTEQPARMLFVLLDGRYADDLANLEAAR